MFGLFPVCWREKRWGRDSGRGGFLAKFFMFRSYLVPEERSAWTNPKVLRTLSSYPQHSSGTGYARTSCTCSTSPLPTNSLIAGGRGCNCKSPCETNGLKRSIPCIPRNCKGDRCRGGSCREGIWGAVPGGIWYVSGMFQPAFGYVSKAPCFFLKRKKPCTCTKLGGAFGERPRTFAYVQKISPPDIYPLSISPVKVDTIQAQIYACTFFSEDDLAKSSQLDLLYY